MTHNPLCLYSHSAAHIDAKDSQYRFYRSNSEIVRELRLLSCLIHHRAKACLIAANMLRATKDELYARHEGQ